MSDDARSPGDDRDLRVFWSIVAVAVASIFVAAVAGLVLVIADPATGSTSDDVIRVVLAVGGLGSGLLFGAAAIWAQVRNLWRFAPMWFRYLAWGALAVIFLTAIVSSALAS